MARQYNDHGTIRQYLLRQLTDDQKQRGIEQRLLSDADFFEELEVAEEELIDEYLAGQLTEDERGRFEQYFLANTGRQQKLRFAQSLSRYVTTVGSMQNIKTPFWSQFWITQNWALPAAAAVAIIVIVVGMFWFSRPRTPSPPAYATLTLTLSASNRAEGSQATKVTLPLNADALRLRLELPETSPPATRYRVELLREKGANQTLRTVGQDEQSVIVEIPAAQLSRGQYALNVYATKPDGTDQRIRGSYFFTVE